MDLLGINHDADWFRDEGSRAPEKIFGLTLNELYA
jgi:hypothetical protein|tara:strand:- start:1367 stop:1471 length:105 start_codon:yes stop_codon:yes gene_type:complete